MRGKKLERWVDLVGELAWIGILLGAALVCPISSARHLVEIAHPFEMGALGVGNQRDGRRAERCQIGDLARAVHAHLDHRGLMGRRQTKQGQRQTDVVVQVAPRR